MTSRLSYCDIFTDKDTSELLHPENFEDIQSHVKKYLEKENIKKFVEAVLDEQIGNSKINISNGKNSSENEKGAPSLDFSSNYSFISCLVNVQYNELFNIRRDIKIAHACKAKVEEYDDIDDPKLKQSHE
jgi:hypothetical protein